MEKTRIVIAEDSKLLREGLCLMINSDDSLEVVAEGYTSKEIVDMLCNSPKTIERHRANIMGKLAVNNVSQLTAIAIEKGLVNS